MIFAASIAEPPPTAMITSGVKPAAAQACAETLVEAGVRGILNFSSAQLAVPEGVIVQNVDLAQPLAVLSHAIARQGC